MAKQYNLDDMRRVLDEADLLVGTMGRGMGFERMKSYRHLTGINTIVGNDGNFMNVQVKNQYITMIEVHANQKTQYVTRLSLAHSRQTLHDMWWHRPGPHEKPAHELLNFKMSCNCRIEDLVLQFPEAALCDDDQAVWKILFGPRLAEIRNDAMQIQQSQPTKSGTQNRPISLDSDSDPDVAAPVKTRELNEKLRQKIKRLSEENKKNKAAAIGRLEAIRTHKNNIQDLIAQNKALQAKIAKIEADGVSIEKAGNSTNKAIGNSNDNISSNPSNPTSLLRMQNIQEMILEERAKEDMTDRPLPLDVLRGSRAELSANLTIALGQNADMRMAMTTYRTQRDTCLQHHRECHASCPVECDDVNWKTPPLPPTLRYNVPTLLRQENEILEEDNRKMREEAQKLTAQLASLASKMGKLRDSHEMRAKTLEKANERIVTLTKTITIAQSAEAIAMARSDDFRTKLADAKARAAAAEMKLANAQGKIVAQPATIKAEADTVDTPAKQPQEFPRPQHQIKSQSVAPETPIGKARQAVQSPAVGDTAASTDKKEGKETRTEAPKPVVDKTTPSPAASSPLKRVAEDTLAEGTPAKKARCVSPIPELRESPVSKTASLGEVSDVEVAQVKEYRSDLGMIPEAIEENRPAKMEK